MQISAAKIMHANVMESDRKNHNVTKKNEKPCRRSEGIDVFRLENMLCKTST